MNISVVIPNYNGAFLLEKNLSAVKKLNAEETIIVDDASTDNSLSVIPSDIILIKNEKNLGFIKSVNRGVSKAKGDIVILLNNDVTPKGDFTDILKTYFNNPKFFAVSFNEPNWSYAFGKFENGFVEHSPGPKTDKPHISFWASGGSAAYRKSYWDKLGGFDEIYEPFYWEDIDLSYRAWKEGYEVWWEPKAIVSHDHETTISSHFSKQYISEISERNRLLFIWKNISDKELIREHRFYLLKKLKKPKYLKIFLEAIIRSRYIKHNKYKISDKEILNKFI